jgi:PadR family transcriptional regulator, regulatory protein PadR
MTQGKYVELSVAQRAEVWRRWKAGDSLHTIGRAVDRPHTSIHCLLARHGGIVPAVRRRSRRVLTAVEREDISRGLASGAICDPLTFYRGRPNLPVESLQESVLSPEQTNLLQGTLDMVILKALRLGEMHGLGISRRIEQISQGTFVVKSGSLFPALRRMQEEGWISSAWGESETNRRAKYYRLTKAGVKQLEEETAKWERIVLGISRTLEAS